MPNAPLLASLLAVLATASAARSQCGAEWALRSPQAELTGAGRCSTVWDPDGAGPAPSMLVVGGSQLLGGTGPVNTRVVAFDGTRWQSVGDTLGTAGTVNALTTWNGLLVAGGTFTGNGTDYIALWDGAAWQALGTGLPGAVSALTVWNGNLVALGNLGGTARIWNGVAWTTLTLPTTGLFAVTSFQGLLCFGGNTIQRWNGTSWLPSIPVTGQVHHFAVRVFGLVNALYAAGNFSSIGGVPAAHIATTAGGSSFTWSQLGNGLPNSCTALYVGTTASLFADVVAGIFNAPTHRLVAGSFVPMGTLGCHSLTFHAGSFVSLTFTAALGTCFRFDGVDWVPVKGEGLDKDVIAATPIGDDVVVGGFFPSSPGIPGFVARWNGTTFQALGSGVNGAVTGLATLKNGDVVAGGLFTQAGGVAANHVARWNGTSWSALGPGLDGPVSAFAELPNGDLVVGGQFAFAGGVPAVCVARWNGSTWSALGQGMSGGLCQVYALAVRGDGRLFAAGTFPFADGITCNNVAQWDGSMWLPMGSGCNGEVRALVARPNGDIVAAGAFSSAGGSPAITIARWNGSLWIPIPSPNLVSCTALAALPDGDLVYGSGSVPSGLSRLEGTTWTAFGNAFDSFYANETTIVNALTLRRNGDLVVGGRFRRADGAVARNLAILRPDCAPTAATYGTGCSSGVGPLSITADTLPWIGASFRTTTTGVAPGSLCLGLIGLTQLSIPLPALLPEGQPGCSLLSSLDIPMLLTNGPGNTATSSFALADDVSLIGVPFFQQTIPLEFDALGAITAIRASNALSLVIGTL